MSQDIHLVAHFGSRKTMSALLAQGADVDARHAGGRTPLMDAACRGRVEMVRMLLQNGANLFCHDNMGLTAMDHAVYRRHIPVIKILYRAHPLLSFQRTTFQAAALLGDKDAVLKYLVAEPNRMPDALYGAAWAGKTPIMAALLQNGGNIHQTYTRDHYGLLHIAVGYGHTAMIRFLLKHGASIDARSNTGGTVLMSGIGGFGEESAADRRYKALQIVLEQGADVDAVDNDGRTALMCLKHAPRRRRLDFARLLIDYKADLHIADGKGRTALVHAEENNLPELATFLREHGA
jgi:ankyrin repeat protein